MSCYADGIYLVEADRLLKPGGYFVWTSPVAAVHGSTESKENQKKWQFVQHFAEGLCWDMLSQQDDTVIWRKTTHRHCYASQLVHYLQECFYFTAIILLQYVNFS